jgi:hypothetical protein
MLKKTNKLIELVTRSTLYRQFHTTVNNYDVTVRTWHPDPEKRTVGHSSIETSKYYISLWPGGDGAQGDGILDIIMIAKETIKNGSTERRNIKVSTYEGALIDTYNEDTVANGIPDEKTGQMIPKKATSEIILRTLDEEKINAEFEKIKTNQELKWTLIGDNKFFSKEGIHSCASLVSHLLKIGGIEKIINEGSTKNLDKEEVNALDKFIHDNIVATPRNVEMVSKMAEKAEHINANKTIHEKDTERDIDTDNKFSI